MMQAYDSAKDEFYCDLYCFECDGYTNKPCLLSGTVCMRMMMAQCLGLHKMLTSWKPIEAWAKLGTIIVKPGSEPPEYPRETTH